MNEAIVWLLCILWLLFCILDTAIYLCTPLKERLAWPPWRYLPGGAIVGRFRNKEQ